MPGVSVEEYAREILRLSKYAHYIIPIEATQVERFRAGLVAPLYNILFTIEFPILSKLIDKTKLWEIRDKEERLVREQKRQGQMRGQGSRSRIEENRPYKRLRNQPRYQASHFGAVNHLSRMHGSIAIAFDLRDYSCYIYAA